MKKLTAFFVLSMLVIGSLSAKILAPHFKITESEEEFDVIYYVYDDVMEIVEDKNEDVAVTQAFKVRVDDVEGEIKYSLFTDTGTTEATRKQEMMMWAMMCLLNASGFSDVSALPNGSNFKDADVAKEFNGDFGFTCFIMNPTSGYAGDNTYMNVEFFYKAGQGIVMRSFLSKDVRFFGVNADGSVDFDAPFYKYYHTFKFKD